MVDTIWKERLVNIEFPADTSKVIIPRIEIDRSKGKPIIKVKTSKQSTVKVKVDSTGISAEAICAKQDSIIKILESQIRSQRNITSVQHIPVKKVSWYHTWALYWSLISLPLTIVWLFMKIKKLFMVI